MCVGGGDARGQVREGKREGRGGRRGEREPHMLAPRMLTPLPPLPATPPPPSFRWCRARAHPGHGPQCHRSAPTAIRLSRRPKCACARGERSRGGEKRIWPQCECMGGEGERDRAFSPRPWYSARRRGRNRCHGTPPVAECMFLCPLDLSVPPHTHAHPSPSPPLPKAHTLPSPPPPPVTEGGYGAHAPLSPVPFSFPTRTLPPPSRLQVTKLSGTGADSTFVGVIRVRGEYRDALLAALMKGI